jgi:hypothetical protein
MDQASMIGQHKATNPLRPFAAGERPLCLQNLKVVLARKARSAGNQPES